MAPPTVSLVTPPVSPTATYGANQSVLASYTCAATSPAAIATCTGTVASGAAIDTTNTGITTLTKSFSVTATDNVGQSTTVSTTYTVTRAAIAPPTVTLTTPPVSPTATYTANQVVNANYTC